MEDEKCTYNINYFVVVKFNEVTKDALENLSSKLRFKPVFLLYFKINRI